jgi:hypothetical protein
MLFSINNQKNDVLSILNLWLRFLRLKKKQKKNIKNFEIEIFQFFLVLIGSGVSGIDNNNN